MDFDEILSPALLGDVALGRLVKVISAAKTKGFNNRKENEKHVFLRKFNARASGFNRRKGG